MCPITVLEIKQGTKPSKIIFFLWGKHTVIKIKKEISGRLDGDKCYGEKSIRKRDSIFQDERWCQLK